VQFSNVDVKSPVVTLDENGEISTLTETTHSVVKIGVSNRYYYKHWIILGLKKSDITAADWQFEQVLYNMYDQGYTYSDLFGNNASKMFGNPNYLSGLWQVAITGAITGVSYPYFQGYAQLDAFNGPLLVSISGYAHNANNLTGSGTIEEGAVYNRCFTIDYNSTTAYANTSGTMVTDYVTKFDILTGKPVSTQKYRDGVKSGSETIISQ